MLLFEKFLIAPGVELDARVDRGAIHVLGLEADDWQQAFLDRYLADLTGGAEEGDVLLEEVRDAEGHPRRLRELPVEAVRGYFAQFVGFVLRDGGLIDTMTVRENLLLPFRYAQVWPRRAPLSEGEIAERMGDLLAFPGAPAIARWLDHFPRALTLFQRRVTGLLRSCLRHPDLLIVFAPLGGLAANERRAWWNLLQHYRSRRPRSAQLLVLNHPDELTGLPGAVEIIRLPVTVTHPAMS
jgi:ABC-type lipoprotein export system ATPase subunit